LPYIIFKYLEFRAFLYVYNYTLTNKGGLLYKLRRLVPLFISKTFVIYKEILKEKLKKALLKLHFTINY
ncbi:hypothetical protein V2W45_1224419, partial [Cenococcum geophilum]